LRDNLKRVVTNSNGGNIKKSNGAVVYMDINSMVIARVIFKARRKSRIIDGNGIIITTSTPTTPMTVITSLNVPGLILEFTTSSILIP
jgi:hypothetical protein